MDDVSRELGISKKTLYQYVRDKDELVRMVVELEISSHQDHIVSCFNGKISAIEELVNIAHCINFMLKEYSAVTEYDLRKYYPDLYVRVREVRRERIFRFFQENLNKGKDEGLYREEINVGILSKVIVSNIDSMFESEIISIPELLDQHYFFEYFVYHLRGIVSEKGLMVLKEHFPDLQTENTYKEYVKPM